MLLSVHSYLGIYVDIDLDIEDVTFKNMQRFHRSLFIFMMVIF